VCDDGDACTTSDSCISGACTGGPAPNCNDGQPCTDDACDSQAGCQNTPNVDPCNDGNACTTSDTCAGGVCVGGAQPNCDDGNPCTDDVCDVDIGCQSTANSAPCDDANACTTSDTCAGGTCVGGASLGCNDGNACTDDSCDVGSGCIHANNSAGCSDGNACTTSDTCSGGSCVGGAALPCNDGNVCTDDNCEPASGCTYPNNGVACDDGDSCTELDTCSGGSCSGDQATVKVYDYTVGAGTLVCCACPDSGKDYLCSHAGYGAWTGAVQTGDYQAAGTCWAVGEADGHTNKLYSSCGAGCTHFEWVECYQQCP
jgi:hypothetical protein